MNSLFARVFLSVWIVLGIIIAGCVATTTLVAWHRISALSEIDFSQLNREAQAVVHSQGENGLRTWLQEVSDRFPGVDIYILDRAGRDLRGRYLPQRLARWLALGNGQSLITGGRDGSPLAPSFQYSASHLLDSSRIEASNGKSYTLAVAWFGSSPIDVLGSYSIVPLLLILALFVSVGVSWLLARYISDPIYELQKSARVLARGNLDAKVDSRFIVRSDEIGVLAREFNHMALQLKEQIEAKELLLRDISHELRSPLGRIQVALGLAALKGADVETQHERIERDIDRMNTLIGEIIRLARLTGAPQSVSLETVDVGQLLERVVDDALPEVHARGCRIACKRGEGLVLRGNLELLRRAIENVLRNAIRFSPERTEIEVNARRDPEQITIEVRDKGPGVPEADTLRIFDPFYRVSNARERDSGGTGLGLAITARVMSLHAGQVTAQNAPEGGLVVTLVLPADLGNGHKSLAFAMGREAGLPNSSHDEEPIFDKSA